MTGQQFMTCRFCGRDDLSPQGHKPHETNCDENPNPGIQYDQQIELGIIDGKEADDEPNPNPDQSVTEGSAGGLPSVDTLGGSKSPTDEPERVTDGGDRACPLCGSDDVLDADDAKEQYIAAVETPNAKAVLGYELAEHACTEPECAALWGPKYDEPLPMSAVVNA